MVSVSAFSSQAVASTSAPILANRRRQSASRGKYGRTCAMVVTPVPAMTRAASRPGEPGRAEDQGGALDLPRAQSCGCALRTHPFSKYRFKPARPQERQNGDPGSKWCYNESMARETGMDRAHCGIWLRCVADLSYVADKYKAHIDQQTAGMAVEVNNTAKGYAAPTVNAARHADDREKNRMDNLDRTDP